MDEFKIIDKFVKPLSRDSIVMGRGDDCSVLRYDDEFDLLQTTDCLIEDVHFRRQTFSMAQLAYKALAVNISDIAAMGGEPRWAHLTLGLPKDISEDEVEEFFRSFNALSEEHNISLLGGDLSASPQSLFVAVHLSGLVKKGKAKLREGLSQPGLLCVSGFLGDSAAGLYALEQGDIEQEYLIACHRNPPIELKVAQSLVEKPEVLGMMDLSDGLLSDLKRLSTGRFEIQLENIPLSSQLKAYAEKKNVNPLQWALAGGEDYRLLFNTTEQSLANRYHVIGEVASGNHSMDFFLANQPTKLDFQPFRHFD